MYMGGLPFSEEERGVNVEEGRLGEGLGGEKGGRRNFDQAS